MSKLLFSLMTSSLVATAILLNGCSKSSDPAAPRTTIADYVGKTMAARSPEDRAELMKLTTGEAKKALEQMKDTEFKSTFIDQKREFISLKVREEREISPGRYSITYELQYKNRNGEAEDLVTLKKSATLVKESPEGRWLISEVQNIKTNIEHQNAISL